MAASWPRRAPTDLYRHPSELVQDAVRTFGIGAVVETCVVLLEGGDHYADLPVPLAYFGGAHAAAQLRRGRLRERGQDYWPRVWAARALRYTWLDSAEPPVVAALGDPAWRVAEMSAKVVALRELGSAADQLVRLLSAEVPRVRVAGCRALGAVGEYEHAELLLDMLEDVAAVRVAAEASLRSLRLRLDRDI